MYQNTRNLTDMWFFEYEIAEMLYEQMSRAERERADDASDRSGDFVNAVFYNMVSR